MKIQSKISFFILFWCSISLLHAQDTILNRLSNYIDEYRIEAIKDSSMLWGISFDAPLMIAIPDVNLVVLNKPAPDFKQFKNIWYGFSKEILPGGNGSKTWNGDDWGFFTYPIPDDKKERLALFFHEVFHRNQPSIDMSGEWTQCIHLNNTYARTLLKLEYNALLKAFQAANFKQHLINALTFRAYRYQLFPNAYIEEQSIETQEGLAEYTGFKLAGFTINAVNEFLTTRMHYNPQTYAYCIGVAYGYILDKSGVQWQHKIKKNDNFIYFSQKLFSLKLPENIKNHIEKTRNEYDWKQIHDEEKSIIKENKQIDKKYQKLFFNNPVIRIELKQCSGFVFQPTIIYPISNGKVYNGFTTKGDWGKLICKDEMFFGEEIRLTTPFTVKNKLIEGSGWGIDLNEKYSIKMIRKGIYEIVKENQ